MGWEVSLRGQLGTLTVDVQFCTHTVPTVIVGPNGAGKTTILRAVTGARLPLEGSIRLNGRLLFDSVRGVNLPPEARGVGYVPQGYALFGHLTTLQNVAFGCPKTKGAPRTQARRALERFEALHLAARFPAELSGGERQRVALARALAPEPRGLLLDEPLAALDPRTRRFMRRYLADYLAREPRPALVVSHDVRDVLTLGGEILVLENGSVIQRGSAAELIRTPKSDFVAELFDTHDAATPPGSRP